MKTEILRSLAFAIILVGCATGTNNSLPGGDADPTAADADPTIPDANPNAPDADPSAPDANPGEVCVSAPSCDLIPQCGCGDRACDLDGTNLATGATTCRDVNGTGGNGEACAGGTSCQAGYFCLSGMCREFCSPQNACSNGDCVVTLVLSGTTTPVPGVIACTQNCTLEAQTNNGCPATFGCHAINQDPDGIAGNADDFTNTDCIGGPATGGGNDTDCTANGSADCSPGFECVNIGGPNPVCKQYCTIAGGSCTTGTCSGLNPAISVNNVEYGLCI
ncbi:MAG: hypothetical protein JKY56_11665 [Kofleriaceae bacterium]|nr:hypothetical protein [Kofleriaceae bacterium]